MCECLHDLEMWQTGDVMDIRVTSHECHCVLNHRQLHCFFFKSLFTRTLKEKNESSKLMAFAKESTMWPVDSPHKGPVMRKMFP